MTISVLIIACISAVIGTVVFWSEFEESQDKVPWITLLGVLFLALICTMNVQNGIIWTPVEYGACLIGVIAGGMVSPLKKRPN